MKNFLIIVFGLCISTSALMAENNESNGTKPKEKVTEQKEVEKQIEREKKYSKEQRFYQGDEYDLKGAEVNKKSLQKIQVLEPEYDFDMDDVYSD